MIKKYLIDGNNLIGKIPELRRLQKTDKQSSREKLIIKLDGFFSTKPQKAVVFFDGFKAEAIPSFNVKIEYCDNRSADEDIKSEIMRSKNPKLLAIVSSDNSVRQFAQKSTCQVIKSEIFARELLAEANPLSESALIKGIDNEEIKKLFGL